MIYKTINDVVSVLVFLLKGLINSGKSTLFNANQFPQKEPNQYRKTNTVRMNRKRSLRKLSLFDTLYSIFVELGVRYIQYL